MVNAYNAVLHGKLSILAASKQFNVPRTTLSERVSGKTALECKPSAKTALTAQEEDALVCYIHYMAGRGYPLTRDQVIGLAWGIARKKGVDCFSDNGPSLKWWRGFRDRKKKELTLRKGEFVSRKMFENATRSCHRLL